MNVHENDVVRAAGHALQEAMQTNRQLEALLSSVATALGGDLTHGDVKALLKRAAQLRSAEAELAAIMCECGHRRDQHTNGTTCKGGKHPQDPSKILASWCMCKGFVAGPLKFAQKAIAE